MPIFDFCTKYDYLGCMFLVTQVVLPLLFAILITRSSFLKFYKNVFISRQLYQQR